MTRLILPVFVALVGLITLNVAWGEAANSSGPSLVPWPKTLRPVQGALAITERSRLVAAEKTLAPLATILSEEIFTVTGVRLATGDGKPGKGDIHPCRACLSCKSRRNPRPAHRRQPPASGPQAPGGKPWCG
ncbi:MAG: hypothetical protein NTU94_02950 [Planctomycetota bacterium]|nr:hypothetical protein [Planctomycetota bacterium]